MKILVLNPNTSESMTAEIEAAASASTAGGTEIVAMNPGFGSAAIDSASESYLSAVGVMDAVATLLEAGQFYYDAVILAGFGEHGKDALQEMLSVPVLDIAECAAHVAHLIGRRFSVITTLARSIAPIEDRLMLAGLDAHCASVRACGLGTAEVDADPAGAVRAIVDEAARAVAEDGADVICLGCAGMAGVTAAISGELGVPAVDGVGAAVVLDDAAVDLLPGCKALGPLLGTVARQFIALDEGRKVGADELHVDAAFFHVHHLAGDNRALLELAPCRSSGFAALRRDLAARKLLDAE